MKSGSSLCLLAFACLWLASCYDQERSDAIFNFRKLYKEIELTPADSKVSHDREPKITLTASGVTLSALLRTISDQSGVSIIAGLGLDEKPCSLDVRDATISEVLSTIARRLGQRVTRIGSVWYIGAIAPEDKGILVRRIHRLSQKDLSDMMKVFSSDIGRAFVSDDGLGVIADRVEVLERVNKALDDIENAPGNSWVMQLYVFNVSDELKEELGLSYTNSLGLAANVNSLTASSLATGALTAMLAADYSDSKSTIRTQPLLICRDGSTSSMTNGQVIPVPKTAISNFGTVETTGFDNVNVGFSLTIAVRDEGLKQCQAKVTLDISSLAGYVQTAPIVQRATLTSDLSLLSGGTYLVGCLDQSNQSSTKTGLIVPFLFGHDAGKSQVYVWLRCYRVGSPVFPVSPNHLEPHVNIVPNDVPVGPHLPPPGRGTGASGFTGNAGDPGPTGTVPSQSIK